jgi:hypothetical protein
VRFADKPKRFPFVQVKAQAIDRAHQLLLAKQAATLREVFGQSVYC